MAKPKGSAHIAIQAVAGSGKTTTLINGSRFLKGQTKMLAYNKRIATELTERLTAMGSNASAQTLHSAGNAALKSYFGKWTPSSMTKVAQILEEEYPKSKPQMRSLATKLISYAKTEGIGLPAISDVDDISMWDHIIDHHDMAEQVPKYLDINAIIEMAIDGLQLSTAQAKRWIDFDDMLYLPLLFDAAFPQFDNVLLDEAQDTNYLRREITKRMVGTGGHMIAVGDPKQAIYGFQGANADAMDLIISEMQCQMFPLTICYRCGSSIVEWAKQWVPYLEADPKGSVGSVDHRVLDQLPATVAELKPGDAVICRNNAPLVDLAFRLIRMNIPARVEGRDIGKNIVALVKRFEKDGANNVGALEQLCIDWRAEEVRKAIRRGADERAASIEDRADTLLEVCRSVPDHSSIEELITKIDSMFKDDVDANEFVRLSSIHKFKGSEADKVVVLGNRQLQPSRFATKEWMQEQEINLMYVAATRARETLIYQDIPERRTDY